MKFSYAMDSRFSGAPGEDFEHWIDRTNMQVQYLRTLNETAVLKRNLVSIMSMLLQGAVYSTRKRLKENGRSDYEAVAKALRRVYGKNKATAWAEFKTFKLAPGRQLGQRTGIGFHFDPFFNAFRRGHLIITSRFR